jgi:hypothetical protein
LIRRSHIGLFLYDADEYFARCSGVLVEMLKAAVPVIAPPGCWMGDQIAESIQLHRDGLIGGTRVVARLNAADADWEAGRAQRYYIWRRDARLLVGRDAVPPTARLQVPDGATHVGVRFRWTATNGKGSYLEVAAAQAGDSIAPPSREIVGMRAAGKPVMVLFPIVSQAAPLELRWRNAFGESMLEVEDLEFQFLSAGAQGLPLGSVGLLAAGIDQVPRLLRDVADHYEHYRRSAEAFAPAWGEWHSPDKVVRMLTETRPSDVRVSRHAA